MSGHRVIAVVDKQGEMTAVWHVQTSADAPAASGLLSGAWLLGPGEIDPARLVDLTAGAYVLDTGGDGLRVIREGVEKRLAGYQAAAKDAVEANPQLKPVRFAAPEAPDLEQLAAAYRGEPAGQRAWAHATAAAELVAAWHTIESQRRSRKYLQEKFGPDTLPLPLG